MVSWNEFFHQLTDLNEGCDDQSRYAVENSNGWVIVSKATILQIMGSCGLFFREWACEQKITYQRICPMNHCLLHTMSGNLIRSSHQHKNDNPFINLSCTANAHPIKLWSTVSSKSEWCVSLITFQNEAKGKQANVIHITVKVASRRMAAVCAILL